jgi:hypothetical protein
MLLFKVHDQDRMGETVLCVNALSLDCIRPGVRVVSMKDKLFNPSNCSLLC